MKPAGFILIDASLPNAVAAGTLDETGRRWKRFALKNAPALEGVFDAAAEAAPQFRGNGFLFCEGPGSILGIRIAAMAIRGVRALENTDKPVLAFQSLPLAAELLIRAGTAPRGNAFSVIAESRMNRWNVLSVPAEKNSADQKFFEIETAALTELPEPIFVLPRRRAGTLPIHAEPVNPLELLKNDPAVFDDCPELLRDCAGTPDAVNTASADSYVKWIPERHRKGN